MWLVLIAKPKWQWLMLLMLMAVAPLLYAIIIGYWALLLVPVGQLLSIAGKMPYTALIVAMNFLGALIVGALVSLPLGYAVNERPFLFGALLSAAPVVCLLWVVEDGTNLTPLLKIARLAEYLGIVLAFVVMAKFGAFLKKRKTT